MKKITRRQLTLFLNPIQSDPIEMIRQQFNPVQHSLIKSHITLCREDEIAELARVKAKLASLQLGAFELFLGNIVRFSDGKGVYLEVKDEAGTFAQLRSLILQVGDVAPRYHEPHITLMHPRNSTCDDEKFAEIMQIHIPKQVHISTISLIEQEMGKRWQILEEYELKGK